MGMVYADIELYNGIDLYNSKSHLIGEDEVRSFKLNMMVDTGALMLCINENIQEILNLPKTSTRKATLANNTKLDLDVVGPIEVRFQNRNILCEAMVLPGDSEPLLGAIPMEGLDVIVHPASNTSGFNPSHGNDWLMMLR